MPYKDKEKQRLAGVRNKLKKRQENKIIVLNMYGNKCQKCGFDNPIALQLDHIERIVRKTSGNVDGSSGSSLWSKVAHGVLPKEMFMLLCANCHAVKTYEDVQKNKASS